jgi:hypothetical protein
MCACFLTAAHFGDGVFFAMGYIIIDTCGAGNLGQML